MKKLLILLTILSLAVGCNRSSTTATGVGTTRAGGDTRRSEYNPGDTTNNGAKAVVKRLTLTAANDQTINRGSTDKVLITINRDNFNDPVTITFDKLPQGVSVVDNKDMVIATGSNTLTVTLKAEASAPVGEHLVTINATSPGVDKITHPFKLTIK